MVPVVTRSHASAHVNPLWGDFAVTGVKLATGDCTRLPTLEIPAVLVGFGVAFASFMSCLSK